ncbi:uncharacterized protein BDV17DRAFT_290412 [Aspergillus undulatus]|uniref:uncharacterized protein n=1 Tax=Aspergillus undulatus TaxID=1810928 RepID=UPI003CCDD574
MATSLSSPTSTALLRATPISSGLRSTLELSPPASASHSATEQRSASSANSFKPPIPTKSTNLSPLCDPSSVCAPSLNLVPTIASALFGFGTITIFISSYMYIIHSYDTYAASALGFMPVSRYCAAGGLTIFGIPFYQGMGVHYTLTILGCISALMVPVPYVFWRFGPVVGGWSRYAHD